MVFSSPVFLFVFLPLTLAAYFVAPRRFRNAALLLASLYFYAWGEKGFVLLMLGSIAANFGMGRVVESGRERRWGRAALATAIIVNIVPLIYFKYTYFIATSIGSLLALPVSIEPIHLPIGISFFTFEAIAYLIDVRRGVTGAQRDPVKFGLFMTLFPHLIAGPVVRYRDLEAALERRDASREQFAAGVRRFIIGLAKKVLLSNVLAGAADAVFDQSPEYLTTSGAWLGVLCYTLHIYFDFSGYSDMAIGLGRLFGFELCENFRYPYSAASITEFWRRWHISLSSWFRDYVYLPLGGNRRGNIRTAINLLIVFVLCGLWHGASWTFLVWGLYHGGFLVLERLPLRMPRHALLRPIRHALTIVVVMIGWVFFRCETIRHAIRMLDVMFGAGTGHGWADYWNRELALVLAIGIVASMPVWPLARSWRDRWSASRGAALVIEIIQMAVLVTLFALCIVSLAAGTFNPFIYFRF